MGLTAFRWLLLLCCLTVPVAWAPCLPFNFERLGFEQGLGSERVQVITQDQEGFLWVGTWNGLYRWDGQQFRLFEHNPEDPSSLGSNLVTSLCASLDGSLWVGLGDGGVDRYNPDTQLFTHFRSAESAGGVVRSTISALKEYDGAIWIATQQEGIYRLEPSTGKLQHYGNNPADNRTIVSNRTYALLFDRTGSLWVGTDNGLDRMDPNSGYFTHFLSDPSQKLNTAGHLLLSLAEDSEGNLWLAVYGLGVLQFDPRTGSTKRYLIDNPFRVIKDKAGTLWVGTTTRGLNQYLPETDRFLEHQNDPERATSLPLGRISSVFEDAGGSLWLAIDGSGLAVWHPAKTAFSHYTSSTSPNQRATALSSDSVRAIVQDHNGSVWLGTAAGLNRLDSMTGLVQSFRHNPSDSRSLAGDSLYAVLEDRAGAIWAGGFTGLSRLDPNTGRFTRFQHEANNPQSLADSYVNALCEDTEGNLWIGTKNGLDRFESASGTFFHVPSITGQVQSLAQGSQSALWVGTFGSGLYWLPLKGGPATRFVSDPVNPSSLSSDSVCGIYEDRNGNAWVATLNGLNRIDAVTKAIKRYFRKDGLAADTVLGVVEDDKGLLWISTFGGLSRLDPQSGTFQNYDRTDGLNNLEFEFNAYSRTRDGRLWFGGKRGIDIVDPNKLGANLEVPPVAFTNWEVNNVPRSFTKAKSLELSSTDRVLTVGFAVLNFVNPAKNQYRYQLVGFDKDWVATTSQRPFATYTNLNPGDYLFRVKGANNDGVWNEVGTSFQLTVLPAWWQTWWFVGSCVIAIMTLFGFVYQTKARQLRIEKASAALTRVSEVKYRTLFESFPMGISVTDSVGKILEANTVSSNLLGIPIDDYRGRLIGGPEWQILRADGTVMPPEEYAASVALREHRRVDNQEMVIVRQGQEKTSVWLNVTAAPIPLEGYGVVIGYHDVTVEKETEKRIRFQATLLDAVGQAVIATDPAGVITYLNRAAEKLYGWSASEALGRNIMEVTVPTVSQAQGQQIMERLSQGCEWSGEFKVCHRNQTTFLAEVIDTPILAADGSLVGIIGISSDITQKKQKEAENLRQERLAAVGQLAAGIAHDFNNLLTGIIGFAELLKLKPEVPEGAHPDLTRIIKQGHRAAQLTRQILDFSRQSVIEPRPLDLKSHVNESIRFLERTIPETIEMDFSWLPFNYTINADPAGLQQILTNLAVNARDAMPQGGRLTFALSRFSLAPLVVPPCEGMPPGEWVKLSVSDNGTGMTPEVLPHIFEPFFTTKELGKGTGLGLAQLYGIVKQHLGFLSVESQEGKGTTFSLYFPAIDTAPVLQGEAVGPVMGNGQTVLIVEDDPQVLQFLVLSLERLNYQVLTATNGGDGLEVYRAHAHRIALVLSDRMMPLVDGLALARTLLAEAPSLKIILMSGYSHNPNHETESLPNVVALLPKPTSLDRLSATLAKALS